MVCETLVPTLGSSVSALLPPFWGSVSAANGGVWTQCVGQVAHFNLTPETSLYVDGLICYHSCCQVLQLNLTARILNHQTNKKASGVGLKCATTYDFRVRERPFTPFFGGQ